MRHSTEQGGLSGAPVFDLSNIVIRALYKEIGDAIPIIGVGGILRGQDARVKIQAGAQLVQLYSGAEAPLASAPITLLQSGEFGSVTVTSVRSTSPSFVTRIVKPMIIRIQWRTACRGPLLRCSGGGTRCSIFPRTVAPGAFSTAFRLV